MANGSNKLAPAPAAVPAVQPAQVPATTESALSIPDYVNSSDRRGVETIGKSDMTIPRLALAQNQSAVVTDGDPRRIPDLKPGELFNSVTKVVYGTRVVVQILRKDRLRAMHLRSINDGGGVIDPNVPIAIIDPKTKRKKRNPLVEWGPNGEKPIATVFRDYMARLLPSGELIALSFKSSGIAAAKELNGLITTRAGGGPIFATQYAITTAQALLPKPHKIYKVAVVDWVSKLDYQMGEAMYISLKDLDVDIDRDISDDEDFLDGDSSSSEPGDHDDSIPF